MSRQAGGGPGAAPILVAPDLAAKRPPPPHPFSPIAGAVLVRAEPWVGYVTPLLAVNAKLPAIEAACFRKAHTMQEPTHRFREAISRHLELPS
jgi:hypothetical protein